MTPVDPSAVRAKLRNGDAAGALADVQRLVADHSGPPTLDTYALLLEIHHQRGDAKAFLGTIDEIVRTHPGSPLAAAMLLGIAHSQVARQGGMNQPGRLALVRQLTDRILTYYPETPSAQPAKRIQDQLDSRLAGSRSNRGRLR
jgi:hypothetical protein